MDGAQQAASLGIPAARLQAALREVVAQQELLQEARAAIQDGRPGEVFIPVTAWPAQAFDPRDSQMLAHIGRAMESLCARLAQHGLVARRAGGFAIDLARVKAALPAIRANAAVQVRTVQHYTVPAAAGLVHAHGTPEQRARSRAWMQP